MRLLLCTFDIYLPYSHSLKEKRRFIRKIKDGVKHHYNVSISEVDYSDKWQRTKLALAYVGKDGNKIKGIFQKIRENIEQEDGVEILTFTMEDKL